MSPKVLEAGELFFSFRSYDALHENMASIHGGKGSQDDHNDAKIWLEPKVEIGRLGRTLRRRELNRAIRVLNRKLIIGWGNGMTTSVKQAERLNNDEQIAVKRFKVQHPVSAYTLPTEAKNSCGLV